MGAGPPLPGEPDGFDAGSVVRRGRVVDDQQLGPLAAGGFVGLAPPLAVDVDDRKACREARSDFRVEEVAPGGFADSIAGEVGWAQAEVEAGVDPVAGCRGMGGVALKGAGCDRCTLLAEREPCGSDRTGEEDGEKESAAQAASAVVGSIMARTACTESAGNWPSRACSRTVASSGAM